MKILFRYVVFAFLGITTTASMSFAVDENYKTTLYRLCDALLATQINNPSDDNYGALVCPSTNPDKLKIHSRSAEAVYPFAVAFKHSGQPKYRDAAIKVGNWLISIQGTADAAPGAWSEDWPKKGWVGTTADQLISLAGAYPIVKSSLSTEDSTKWNNSIVASADWMEVNFPLGPVNYFTVGAAALHLAYQVVENPKASWLTKAKSLIEHQRGPIKNIITDSLLHGEGSGVDLGYNISQSIGYIALYGLFTNDESIRQKAADLLRSHYLFVYPGGTVDNSWGTRSFKFGWESGTKTAPGVQFSFALLADLDPKFNAAGLKTLEYLSTKAMNSDGWVTYGPHAHRHASSNPPCNYQTFARAQNIALAIEYGPTVTATEPFPAQVPSWYKYFSETKVAVVRTKKIMGTVSAYGRTSQWFGFECVPRGGSITALWYEGFGENGFIQTSSVNSYHREEGRHMPIEGTLLPLTSRIETAAGTYHTNLYDTSEDITVVKEADHVKVTTSGKLCTPTGTASKINFTIVNRFYDDYVKKEYTVSGAAQAFRIVEPIVNDAGTVFAKVNSSTVSITPSASSDTWNLNVLSSPSYTITTGTNQSQYWSPFPGIEAYPILIEFSTTSTAAQTVVLTITGPSEN